MIDRIYIDTSIVGGYFDDDFSADTQALYLTVQKIKKEQIQAHVYAETKNMSKEELLRYFNGNIKNAKKNCSIVPQQAGN